MICDPIRQHRFRSCHTVYSVHFVHGRHTGPSHRSMKSQLSVVPANIRATTRRYRKVRHTQITLRHATVRQLCYPSKISIPIVVIFSSAPFFSTGGSPSHTREYGKQRAQIIRRTLAIIQSESTTHMARH